MSRELGEYSGENYDSSQYTIDQLKKRIHANGLTPAEAERLAILIEECGEIIQAASKVLRHGYESYNPTVAPELRDTNRQSLMREIGDLDAICGRMVNEGDIDRQEIVKASTRKMLTLKRWTHHQVDSQHGRIGE